MWRRTATNTGARLLTSARLAIPATSSASESESVSRRSSDGARPSAACGERATEANDERRWPRTWWELPITCCASVACYPMRPNGARPVPPQAKQNSLVSPQRLACQQKGFIRSLLGRIAVEVGNDGDALRERVRGSAADIRQRWLADAGTLDGLFERVVAAGRRSWRGAPRLELVRRSQ